MRGVLRRTIMHVDSLVEKARILGVEDKEMDGRIKCLEEEVRELRAG
jgi:hypothetical protein